MAEVSSVWPCVFAHTAHLTPHTSPSLPITPAGVIATTGEGIHEMLQPLLLEFRGMHNTREIGKPHTLTHLALCLPFPAEPHLPEHHQICHLKQREGGMNDRCS